MRFLSILKVVGGITLVVGLLGIIVGGYAWTALRQHQLTTTTLGENLSGTVTAVTTAATVRQAISSLQLSEEMLAQSARNYAATEEAHWLTQYDEARREFDQMLSDIQTTSGSASSTELDSVVNSAQRLAVISAGAIQLVESGRSADATEVLNGQQYTAERAALESSIHGYAAVYADQVGRALGAYENGIAQANTTMKEIVYTSIGLTAFTLLAGFVLTGIFVQLRLNSWRHFAEAVTNMAAHDFADRLAPSPDASVRPLTGYINSLADRAGTAAGKSEATFKAAHEALLVIDDDGTIQSANTAALDIFELPQKELVGKSLDELQTFLRHDS